MTCFQKNSEALGLFDLFERLSVIDEKLELLLFSIFLVEICTGVGVKGESDVIDLGVDPGVRIE
jgi:hypothetical protein